MEVLVAGGHGQIALRLLKLLSERGHRGRGLIRNPDHAADLQAVGAEPVLCDLESDDPRPHIGAADAIVFAAGAGPGSGSERKLTMDLGGAVKLIAAAKGAGIRRYVIVSSRGADPDASGDDTFSVYLRAKGQADAELAASGLDYTIVRPGGLTDEPGTGRVRTDSGDGSIPREDVAAVLAAALAEPGTIGATFLLVSGDTPIDEAVKAV
jgi:nucleoside-diphosphate-sugar epimerase